MDRAGSEELYDRESNRRVDCGVVELVERSSLRWYGYIRRMPEERMLKGCIVVV